MARVVRLYQMEPQARDRLISRIASTLAGRPDVSFAMVYGSFVDGPAFRDIDLGLWTTESSARGLDRELAATLSRLLGLPVDVRRINDAPVPFLYHVLRGRVVAAHDEERLVTLMERTARDYHDRAPLLRRATREAFAG